MLKIPAAIKQDLTENFEVDINAFEDAHTQTTPVSIRLNPLKPACAFPLGEKVAWTDNAFYLPERPVFTNDPLFHAGCYYVQEASSMFVEEAVRQTVDLSLQLTVLDACAAPGGKSTLLASLLNEKSLLVSNEVISTRTPVLLHNMAKWGSNNSIVTQNDPHNFGRLPNFFDVVVVDAPCSGSGLFRKQHDAVEHWSEENVTHCSLRQQRILNDLLPSLKENGILIYSTCSYSTGENENIADHLCGQFSLETIRLNLAEEWKITETISEQHKAYGYRFFPHLTKGEGFFLACFRKKGTTAVNLNKDAKPKSGKYTPHKKAVVIPEEEQKIIRSWVNAPSVTFIKHFDDTCGFHSAVSEEVGKVLSSLKVKKLPFHFGQLKGKDFVPHTYLAYQPILNTSVSRTEVDVTTALHYLRKQPLVLPGATKGFDLLTYKNFALGWMKNLGNRVNNYYPAEWRILKETF